MLSAHQPHPRGDHELTLDDVLGELVRDGLVSRQQTELLRFSLRQADAPLEHPLVLIAAQGWLNACAGHAPLDAERLTRWLADKTGLEYLRIDPLKVDVPTVTGVIKQAYATRFGILPVAVSADEVTVATAEPYVREWEHELKSLLQATVQAGSRQPNRGTALPAGVLRDQPLVDRSGE